MQAWGRSSSAGGEAWGSIGSQMESASSALCRLPRRQKLFSKMHQFQLKRVVDPMSTCIDNIPPPQCQHPQDCEILHHAPFMNFIVLTQYPPEQLFFFLFSRETKHLAISPSITKCFRNFGDYSFELGTLRSHCLEYSRCSPYPGQLQSLFGCWFRIVARERQGCIVPLIEVAPVPLAFQRGGSNIQAE